MQNEHTHINVHNITKRTKTTEENESSSSSTSAHNSRRKLMYAIEHDAVALRSFVGHRFDLLHDFLEVFQIERLL